MHDGQTTRSSITEKTDFFTNKTRFLDKVIVAADSSNCAWFWNIYNIKRTKRNHSHRRFSYRHFTFSHLGCCSKRTVYFWPFFLAKIILLARKKPILITKIAHFHPILPRKSHNSTKNDYFRAISRH